MWVFIVAAGLVTALVPARVAAASAARPSDFDGDGYVDLAIGVPFEDVGSKDDAGAVTVLYGSSTGLMAAGDQYWTQDSPGVIGVAGGKRPDGGDADQFGWALASGDFDRDGYADLAIGVPGDDSGEDAAPSDVGEGSVNVLYGSSSGLTAAGDQRWIRSQLPSAPASHTTFGEALASGDFDGDGYWDLAIRGEEDGGLASPSGRVGILHGGPAGLTSAGAAMLSEAQITGAPSAEDFYFGSVLAAGDLDGDGRADLAAIISDPALSAVGVIYGAPDGPTADPQVWSQDSPGILDEIDDTGERFGASLSVGDFDDDGYGDLAIGVTNENVGASANAGAVNVIYGSAVGLTADGNQFWHEDSAGVPGAAGPGEHLGRSLASADFDGDGRYDLAIGIPDDAGGGAAVALYGSSTGLTATGAQRWTQASSGVPDKRESIDWFGYSLAAANYGRSSKADLAIGVPREWLSGVRQPGMVNVIYGRSGGLSGTNAQGWSQASPGVRGSIEDTDRLGWSLAP